MEDNHTHCQELITSISDYVEGSISPELCLELEKHLSECHNCQVVVNTLKKTIEIYRSHSNVEPIPGDVKSRLLVRLNLEQFKK